MRNIASIELNAYQAKNALEMHIAFALEKAGMEAEKPKVYAIARNRDVTGAAKLLVGWMYLDLSHEYFQDRIRSAGGRTTHHFITLEKNEREINRDSAFEMTVGRASGFMVEITMPSYGEKVFFSEHEAKSDKATQWVRYYGGTAATITARKGSWVVCDGDGDPDTFSADGETPMRFRVGHAVRVGERAVV